MLTGKDVHEALLFANPDIVSTWDGLNTYDRCVYDMAASVLNGTHIAPLQELVRDFARLIDGDDLSLERIGDKRGTLLERARFLCGEGR